MLDETLLATLEDTTENTPETVGPMEIIAEALADIENLDALDLSTASQVELEQLFSKYQLHKAVAGFYRDMGCEQQLEELGIPVAFGIDLLVQINLHKRANIPTMVGLLKKHFQDELNPAQACADAIHKACEEDMLDWDPLGQTLVVRWEISGELQDRIDRFQYPLPMIEEPKTVHHNRQTGYRTVKGSLILKGGNHHDEDICLDHINRVNAIPLALNTDVVAFIRNRWKNLDKPKPGESHEKFVARKKAFLKYDRTSREVISAMLAQGNRFWLTHRYDKRGRTYSQGYHINYQGSDWNKACVEFADAEPLNQE